MCLLIAQFPQIGAAKARDACLSEFLATEYITPVSAELCNKAMGAA